ncbi:MAG: helix-turn-helix domain-containing protein [Clostridiales bacterium]|nr:helix-turn-helix domain-containing protein [Clostridiales bacterium]
MSIGKVIRKYRKIRNMTQEEMALRLGVTAPAVNKWENENSLPDITLLAPIARLLEISLDTLLSFQEELTMDEVTEIVHEVDAMAKEKPYAEVFAWTKKKLEQYPNCEVLTLNLATFLDAQRIVQEIPVAADYDEYLCSLYSRVLNSNDEALRIRAADALIGFFMRKEQYDKAEKYLEYLSIQNPERKRKQAQIYSETGRIKEAYKAYEELLFADYGRVSMELHGMYMLALKSDDTERARMLLDKQEELAKCFEMGAYHEISCRLESVVKEKDADAVIEIMDKMLSAVEEIDAFRNSMLYEHMEFKETSEEFKKGLKEKIREGFANEEEFGFLKNDKRWQEIIIRH